MIDPGLGHIKTRDRTGGPRIRVYFRRHSCLDALVDEASGVTLSLQPFQVVAIRRGKREHGHRVLFLTLETLITRLRRAQAENRLEWQLAQWITPKVLVVDELGYLPMSREEANLFFRLVARRLRAR